MPKSRKKQQQDQSKKALQKKRNQVIEDQTFGLKNKNKSKVVQRKINAIERSVHNGGDPKLRRLEEQRQKAKAEAKARKKALEEERNALFGEALLAIGKKGKTTSQKEGKVEAKGRDADDDSKKPAQSRAMKMMYQMDAKEMEERLMEDPNYVPTIEDQIESQRQRKVAELKASGKKGTPVTPETFKAWQEKKRKRKADEAKKLVEAELKKKKGGKGLAVLSGRALYEYKKELFVDGEAATEEDNSTREDNQHIDGEDLGEKNHNTDTMDTESRLVPETQSLTEDLADVIDKVDADLFLDDGSGADDLDEIE